jgi:hypothetical protein
VKASPLITLGAVAALGIGILIVNTSQEPESAPGYAPVAAPPTATTASAVPAAPETSAPPQPAFPPKADYVGKIPTDHGVITVEITVEGDRAVAYACDGNTVEVWLRGSASNGAVHLANTDDTSRLDGNLEGTAVTGTLRIKEAPLNFIAATAPPPAGLYVYQAAGSRSSWIVDANGAVTGVQRQPSGSTSPAPSLSTDGTAVIDGKTITAIREQGTSNDF